MGNIEQRLKVLERALASSKAQYFGIHADDELPARGWFFYHDGERVDVLRHHNETDGALRIRAGAVCRTTKSPQTFFEIDDNWINHYGLFLPHVMGLEEWELAASTQQAELCRDVTHDKA